MTVYELIKSLANYPSDTEVYFTADGRVSEYNTLKEEQGAVDDDDCFAVQGRVTGVKDWWEKPDIQCEIIY